MTLRASLMQTYNYYAVLLDSLPVNGVLLDVVRRDRECESDALEFASPTNLKTISQ